MLSSNLASSFTTHHHHPQSHDDDDDRGNTSNAEYPKIKQPPPPFEICRKPLPRSLAWSPRGQFSSDGTLAFMIHPNKRQINIIDTETSQLISTFYHDRNDSSSSIESCCFSKHQHNDVLYCFTNDKKLLCIDSLSGRKLFSAPIENDRVIFSQSIATKFPKRNKHDDMSDDDSSSFIEYHVVLVASNTRLGMINHKTNTDIEWFVDFESPLSSIHYSNDLKLLVCGFNSGLISFYKILGETEPESIDLVFKQQLCESPITSCTITNIGRNHDFCLLIGTSDSNLLNLFYFSDYFKPCDLSQTIDLCSVFETNSVTNLQLRTIHFHTKQNRKDSSVAIVVCSDRTSSDRFHVGVFDMNSWIKSEKMLQSSIQDYTAETASCLSSLLDIFIDESSVMYGPSSSISFHLYILSQKTLFHITFENRMNLAIQEVAQRNVEDIVNRDKRRRLIQMCKERGLTLSSDLFHMNTIFDMLYDHSLLSVLVEYIQGTVPNSTDSNLIHLGENDIKVSTAVNQRFAIHDIKDIMVWIKHKKEYEEKKLDEYLNTFMGKTDATSRTIPPLVIAETRNNINMSVQRLCSLRLLISAVINRAKLMEDGATLDVYISSLVNFDHHLRSIAEYARVGEWFLEIGLLPMSANIFNTTSLEKEWKDRYSHPFPPLSEINVSRQEFHAIHDLLRLESVSSDMNPTFKSGGSSSNSNSSDDHDDDDLVDDNNNNEMSSSNTTSSERTGRQDKFFIQMLLKHACREPIEYPPKDLSHFITHLFKEEPLHDDAFIYKHVVMFYFIIDYFSHGMNDQNNDDKTTKKLNSYAKLFKITTPWQHLTFSFWLLDTKRSNDEILNEAVQYACCSFAAPNNGLRHRAWNHEIAQLLVKCSSFHAANRLLEFSSNFDSEVLKTIIYLTNDMVHLAFDMQRRLSHDEGKRRNVFFCILHYSLLGNFFSDFLTTFPFDETERLWIENFLKNKKNYDLLFSYYILNSNYVDAFNLYRWILNSSSTSKNTTSVIDARKSYLDLVSSILPPIQLSALEKQLETMSSSSSSSAGVATFKQLVLKPSLKHSSRLFSERPTPTQKKIKTASHVSSMTSFKAWLENTTGKDTIIRIPSLFDVPKWKRPKKTPAPQLASQNVWRLPSEHKIIEERKKETSPIEHDEENNMSEEEEKSSTTSETSSLEDQIPAESSTSANIRGSTMKRPPPQFGMKTLPPQKASPKYVDPLEISDGEEEEGESDEEKNQEEQMNDEEEEQPVSVRRESTLSDIFEEEENVKGSPNRNMNSESEEESAEEEISISEE